MVSYYVTMVRFECRSLVIEAYLIGHLNSAPNRATALDRFSGAEATRFVLTILANDGVCYKTMFSMTLKCKPCSNCHSFFTVEADWSNFLQELQPFTVGDVITREYTNRVTCREMCLLLHHNSVHLGHLL